MDKFNLETNKTIIREDLLKLQDEKYRDFQYKLTPNILKEKMIGVRVPDVRKLAKKYFGTVEGDKFIKNLPHDLYDENILHGLLLSEMKDYDTCVEEVNKFLPYVDNWAVCDIMSPKIFKKHKKELISEIKKWIKSDKVYECRFGIEMLMSHYLDELYDSDYLELPAQVKLDDYYVKMMIAWFFATALAKQWDSAIVYIKENKLNKWVHNKTIQKARESYRITEQQKEYLKSLKR